MDSIREHGFGAAGVLLIASVVVIVGVVVFVQLRPAPVAVLSPTPTVLPPVVLPGQPLSNITPAPVLPGASYTGAVLAGSQSPLLEFTKADYDKALASNDLIVLYFYANWCPICRAEFPLMQAAFNQLGRGGVVGFRVNFNDDETDEFEKALAREYGVAYQHTKVLVQSGKRILKSPETWDTARYISEISTRLP